MLLKGARQEFIRSSSPVSNGPSITRLSSYFSGQIVLSLSNPVTLSNLCRSPQTSDISYSPGNDFSFLQEKSNLLHKKVPQHLATKCVCFRS